MEVIKTLFKAVDALGLISTKDLVPLDKHGKTMKVPLKTPAEFIEHTKQYYNPNDN